MLRFTSNGGSGKTWRGVLVDMLIDSAVVGGIATLATGFLIDPAISLKVAAAAFGMSFLVKLKELRGVS